MLKINYMLVSSVLNINFVPLYTNIVITLSKIGRNFRLYFQPYIVLITVLIELYVCIFLIFNHHYKKYKQLSLSISPNNSKKAAIVIALSIFVGVCI